MYFYNTFGNTIARCYQWIINFFSKFQSLLLFLLRLTWGHQFFMAGLGKFARGDLVVHYFQNLGFPLPTFTTYFSATLETVGGLALILGFGSRFFALLLSIAMFVAYGTEHVAIFHHFAFVKDPSLLVREAPFPFLLTSLLVLIFGPGRISIDAWIKRWLQNHHRF